jgi:hypothetical protein
VVQTNEGSKGTCLHVVTIVFQSVYEQGNRLYGSLVHLLQFVDSAQAFLGVCKREALSPLAERNAAHHWIVIFFSSHA